MELNLLIDTNVALDFILKREPFFKMSAQIISLTGNDNINEFVSATTVTDIYYIARRHLKDRKIVMDMLKDFLQTVKVANVTHREIQIALNLDWKDFEDSIQYAVALLNGFDAIITCNMEGFDADDAVKIFTSEEFCKHIDNTLKE